VTFTSNLRDRKKSLSEMKYKIRVFLAVFIVLLLALEVKGSIWFRLRSAELYEARGDIDKAAGLYAKVYTKEKTLRGGKLKFYKLSPEVKYEISSKLADYYFKAGHKDKAIEHYGVLKERGGEPADYLYLYILNQNARGLADLLIRPEGRKLRGKLPVEYKSAPLWKYRFGLALAKVGRRQEAEELFEDLAAGFPYVFTFRDCLELIRQGKDISNPPPFEIAGIWKFDYGRGASAFDSSGRWNHGRIYGAEYVEGVRSGALKFDAPGDEVIIPDNGSLNLGGRDFTIALWLRPQSWNGICFVYNKQRPNFFLSRDKEQWGFELYDAGGTKSVAMSQPVEDKWYFVVQRVRQEEEHRAWLFDREGLIDSKGRFDITVTTDVGDPLRLSRKGWYQDSDESFTGVIDEVMIFKKALTDEEIQVLYESFAGKTEAPRQEI